MRKAGGGWVKVEKTFNGLITLDGTYSSSEEFDEATEEELIQEVQNIIGHTGAEVFSADKCGYPEVGFSARIPLSAVAVSEGLADAIQDAIGHTGATVETTDSARL